MRNPFKHGVRYWRSTRKNRWHEVRYHRGKAFTVENCNADAVRRAGLYEEVAALPDGAVECRRCLEGRLP